MPARTGSQFIAGLKARPREVWVRGERVRDVTEHPVFARSVHHLARLYDLQHAPAHVETLTGPSPASGAPVGTSFLSAHSRDDLVKRGRAFRIWAEESLGLMGRTADYMNATLLAFAEAYDFFARGGTRYADNVVRYHEHCRENDLFLTHAIVTPQTDRSRSSAGQAAEFLHLGVVRETSAGIVVRGARMLATLGPVADEVLIYTIPGLAPGDENHALAFGIGIDAPGLRQICREPFDSGGRSYFDHPLAANFEESDALLVFDDVFVPWERVFLYKDVARANGLLVETHVRSFSIHQAGTRGLVKLQFAVGLAIALAQAIKADRHLHVQEMLGECVNYVELVKCALHRAECEYETTIRGTIRANYAPLQTVRTFLPRCYPRVIEVLQTIGAGGLLIMPTEADLASPIGDDVRRYYVGAEAMAAVDRIQLFKLAWDLCGDSFGSRQLQYERYYAGDPVRGTAGAYFDYDKSEMQALVARGLTLAQPSAARD